jgi:type IV secretory pathway TrbD component
MSVEETDADVIHPSLLEPVLIAGVERRVLALEFLFVVLLVTLKGLTPGSVLVALLVVGPAHLAAMRLSRLEPWMFEVLRRHLRWRRCYPPHGSWRAVPPPPRPSVPGGR